MLQVNGYIEVVVPGPPCAQQRGRATVVRGKGGKVLMSAKGQPIIRVYDPEKSSSWKGVAQYHMKQAMVGHSAFQGAVAVAILAVFPCPRSDYKKRTPTPRRYHMKQRGDADNLAKAVLDAAKGVFWLDDCQVARLEVEKHIGAQGEAPYVLVRMTTLPEEVEEDGECEEDTGGITIVATEAVAPGRLAFGEVVQRR